MGVKKPTDQRRAGVRGELEGSVSVARVGVRVVVQVLSGSGGNRRCNEVIGYPVTVDFTG